jgi:hypothetical protein
MATTRHETVVTRWSIDHPVYNLFVGLPGQKLKRRSCGAEAHGLQTHDWTRMEVRSWHRENRRHRVFARRSLSRPHQILTTQPTAPLTRRWTSSSTSPAASGR